MRDSAFESGAGSGARGGVRGEAPDSAHETVQSQKGETGRYETVQSQKSPRESEVGRKDWLRRRKRRCKSEDKNGDAERGVPSTTKNGMREKRNKQKKKGE